MTEERVGKLTVNLLGNIARALTSLRGIDVMAYELIQNAEDSHATQMVINIDDDGIRILTDSVFRNCSDREKDNCLGLNGNKLHKCDCFVPAKFALSNPSILVYPFFFFSDLYLNYF